MYDLQKKKTAASVLMRESKCMRVVHLLHYGQECTLKIMNNTQRATDWLFIFLVSGGIVFWN